MKATRRFFKLLELDRKEIGYIYLYAIFAGIITLTLPLGIQAIINLIVGGETSSSLYLLIGIITIGILLNGLLTVMQLTVTETLQRRIFARSAFEFSWRIPRLKLDELSGIYPPELINRFFDTITLQKGIPKILIDSSTAFLQILFGLILLSLYHPFFVFFGFGLVFILIIIFQFTGRSGMKSSLKESKFKYQVAHWLEELGRAMNIFKASGGSQLPIQKTDGLVCNYLTARKSHFRVLLTQYGSVVLFKTLITGALLLLGSILVIENQISIGQFVAAEIVVLLILNSVEKLILGIENIYDVLTAIEKIAFVTDLPLEQAAGYKVEDIATPQGLEVEIDEVSFQFKDADVPTLRNISLDFKAGEKICIAGYNGSGKTTLVHLIKGMYTDYQGIVSFNGVPLKSLDLEDLRRHIGSLSTSDDIFHGTIIENITLGNGNTRLNEIISIAKDIGLHHFINKLPNAYNTELLAGGINIPGSIRAKIMLTRILLNQPEILIIENFFPRIEKSDKADIIDFITDQEKHWTLIAVSNDKRLAQNCDRILIMKKGQIVLEGKFDEIKNEPYFKDVFEL